MGIIYLKSGCRICGSMEPLTEHHLTPSSKNHGRRDTPTVLICRPCHTKIHQIFNNLELKQVFNNIEYLCNFTEVIAWVQWRKTNDYTYIQSKK